MTSPRTPDKMIPEIDLLIKNFDGQNWNKANQTAFMDILAQEDFYHGLGENEPDFSARDRINRGPKALGFVGLSPISLFDAGKALIKAKRKEEVFLRQLLKFQIPSPYHKPTKMAAKFCVKPYLEMLRLIRELGTLSFDELHIFGMQLTDWHKFNQILKKILRFREEKAKHKGRYEIFKDGCLQKELKKIYSNEIAQGLTKTRESQDQGVTKFLRTKGRNMRDYADACYRYLRATGLINVSHVGKTLSIIPDRIKDVDYILKNINRNPVFVDEEQNYLNYLGDAELPILLTDNIEAIQTRIQTEFPGTFIPEGISLMQLKDVLYDLIDERKAKELEKQVDDIKNFKFYKEIQDTYNQLNSLLDAPLMLEWNTWRAMTMLDGGSIKPNLRFDDSGEPLSTALGNMPDIECDYGNFFLTVEVTTMSGQRQFETEGESVARHLGKIKNSTGKPGYCLFIAPQINEACKAYFFSLYKTNISFYGGIAEIVPLPLRSFQKMIEASHAAAYKPEPSHVKRFFEKSKELAHTCQDEVEWFDSLLKEADNWLEIQ